MQSESLYQTFTFLKENLDTSTLSGSDSSLANMFLLQPKYNTQFYIHQNILFRYYQGNKNRRGWAFPIPLKNAEEDFLKTAVCFIFSKERKEGIKADFCLCSQEQKALIDACLMQHFPKHKINWKSNRDDSDYIYLRENLSELKGSSFQKKRNHISRFNRLHPHDWSFKTFNADNISEQLKNDILQVEEKWFTEKNGPENKALILEKESIYKAFDNAELLGLSGACLYIKEEPVAMTLASAISPSVIDIHFEKAIEQYEADGIFAVINNLFAKECSSFLYINREEDMGVAGLRKAKLSYKPDIILDKFYGKIE